MLRDDVGAERFLRIDKTRTMKLERMGEWLERPGMLSPRRTWRPMVSPTPGIMVKRNGDTQVASSRRPLPHSAGRSIRGLPGCRLSQCR
jgi:hypothetical protein